MKKLINFIKDTKNWIIIAMAILLGLFALFGGKQVNRFNEEIRGLEYDKTRLETQMALRDVQIKVKGKEAEDKQATIDSCMKVFAKKDNTITGLEGELADALERIEGITSDSSYIFLTEIAYAYPGLLSYIFNENQIKAIHADYLRARNSEQIIPEMQNQIDNCTFQFTQRDSLANKLKSIVADQGANLKDCKQINSNNDQIIKDQEKIIRKETRRKAFWRITAALEPILMVVGIILL